MTRPDARSVGSLPFRGGWGLEPAVEQALHLNVTVHVLPALVLVVRVAQSNPIEPGVGAAEVSLVLQPQLPVVELVERPPVPLLARNGVDEEVYHIVRRFVPASSAGAASIGAPIGVVEPQAHLRAGGRELVADEHGVRRQDDLHLRRARIVGHLEVLPPDELRDLVRVLGKSARRGNGLAVREPVDVLRLLRARVGATGGEEEDK